MAHHIEVQNDQNYKVDSTRLVDAIDCVLRDQAVESDMGVTVVITDNEAVRKLNMQFRGIDTPTDVLSFPADDMPIDPDEPEYLGDLIVAYPYTHEQAQYHGHGMDDSLVLLVVHGTLHLLGYDHDTKANRAEMWAVQEQILKQLNVPLEIVPALEGYQHDE